MTTEWQQNQSSLWSFLLGQLLRTIPRLSALMFGLVQCKARAGREKPAVLGCNLSTRQTVPWLLLNPELLGKSSPSTGC